MWRSEYNAICTPSKNATHSTMRPCSQKNLLQWKKGLAPFLFMLRARHIDLLHSSFIWSCILRQKNISVSGYQCLFTAYSGFLGFFKTSTAWVWLCVDCVSCTLNYCMIWVVRNLFLHRLTCNSCWYVLCHYTISAKFATIFVQFVPWLSCWSVVLCVRWVPAAIDEQ